MADDLDVLTIGEACNALNIADSDADDKVAGYVTAVSRQLDERCGPVVVRTVTDELHDGGGYVIFTRYSPIFSVATVTEYAQTFERALTVETNAVKPAAGFLAETFPSKEGVVYRRSGGTETQFAWGRRNVKITYDAGRYATTAATDEKFKQAARIMLANLWRPGQAGGTETFGPFQELPRSGIPTFALPNAVVELLYGEFLAPATP